MDSVLLPNIKLNYTAFLLYNIDMDIQIVKKFSDVEHKENIELISERVLKIRWYSNLEKPAN